MLSNLDPSARQFLNGLERVNERMTAAQRRISTGVRLELPSDDPDHISTLLGARASLEAAKQTQANLSRLKAETDGAEQALQHAVTLFERVRTLATQGKTGTQTADARATLAQEMSSVLEQLVGLAGTTVEGRFVFSGDADQAPPYSIDLAQAVPVSAYLGSPATRLVQHPNGTTFSVSRTAQEIFDSTDPATNVFGTIQAIRAALMANDEAAINDAFDDLTAAGNYLNTQLSFYGTVQNKILEAQNFGENLAVQIQTQISGLQDADLTESIIELNQGQVQQKAALESWTRLPRATLFDYLG